MRFDEHFIKAVLSDAVILHSIIPQEISLSVDSRSLKAGDIFIALPGSAHDGHNFVSHAVENGAAGLIIEHHKKEVLSTIAPARMAQMLVVLVTNTSQALLKLACAWREQFQYPVIAITGSVGKTSTKEIVSNILTLHKTRFIASRDNQNTLVGVAINILKMKSSHEVAIFEVGISRRGEMAQLARLIRPTSAVITNIGHAHMEGLGSLQDIAFEKREIFKYFSEENIGIINGDQPILSTVGYNHPIIRFGSKTTNQIQARKIHIGSSYISFNLKLYRQKFNIVLKQSHEGNVYNALAAAAIAHMLQVPHDMIVKGMQVPLLIPGRFQECRLKTGHGILINDCYNANPESVKTVIMSFQKIDTKSKKIIVLGDMLELGVNSPFWHRQIGRFLRKASSLNRVILVGNMVKWTQKTLPVGLPVDLVPTWKEAAEKLHEYLDDNSVVLVKGSRAVGLDALVDTFVR